MENSIIIESKSLDSNQAKILISILAQTQIVGSAAADMLSLRLALERIASGKDLVSSNVEGP